MLPRWMGGEILVKLVAHSNKPNRKSRSGQVKLATRKSASSTGLPQAAGRHTQWIQLPLARGQDHRGHASCEARADFTLSVRGFPEL